MAPKRHRLPRFFTEAEVEGLLSLPGLSTRDRGLLLVLVDTGLRASEVLAIQVRDIREKVLLVRQGKGGRQRLVPLSSRLTEALVPLMAARTKPDEVLFRNAWGEPLSRRGLHGIVKDHLQAAGLEGSCHTLRHSLATNLLNRGLNLRSVQAILGHADIETTGRYLHCATDRLCEDYLRAWG